MKILKPLLATMLTLAFGTHLALASTLAIVDKKKITEADLAFFKQIIPNFNYAELSPADKKLAVEQAIDRMLIIRQAKKEGINNTIVYRKAMGDASNKFLMDLWVKQLVDKISKEPISDAKAKDYYNDNKTQFTKQEAKASHILVKSEKTAQKIIDILNKTPKNKLKAEFAKLAKQYSIDTSTKGQGGNLGYFDRNAMDASFSKAVFALSDGEYTKSPIKTQFGYHVILLEDKKASKEIPFKDVKGDIINAMKAKIFQAAVKDKVKILRKKANIKIFVK